MESIETNRYTVDFSKVGSVDEIHRILKESLSLPDYYGANFDALWDCLTDFLGCISHIYFLGMERVKDKFPSFYEKFTALLQDVKHAFRGQFADRFCVFFIHSDGSTQELL